MIPDSPRPLSHSERTLVHALLAPTRPEHEVVRALDALVVVRTCDCGCASFEMAPSAHPVPPATYGRQLADAYGTTPDGRPVGLILWATDAHPTYMELYSLASDPPFALPAPGTITDLPPWPEPPAE